jgi:hypothetical protein
MRLGAIVLALPVLLASCSLHREPAPSGEPVELSPYAGSCADSWVEGSLRHRREGGIDIVFSSLDTVDWPEGVGEQNIVSVQWPVGFTGVRLAGGQVAVVDASGNVAAMTGTKYRLKGSWLVIQPFGEPHPRPLVVGGFWACGDESSVIPR